MRTKKNINNLIMEILLWIFSIIFIYPLLMVLITSFKSYGEANFLSIALPEKWLFENYMQVFKEGKILSSFFNSVYITVFSVALVVLLSSTLAYILMRRRDKINNMIYRGLTFGIIAPFAAMPTIQLLKAMGIYGSRTSLIFIYAAMFLPFSTMLYASFVVTLPQELDEAGIIDGCTGFSLFRRIIFPLLQPITVTVGVLNFMWIWNDFQNPVYLLNSSAKWTLPMSVYNFYGQFNRSWNLVSANMVIVSLPVIIIYLFAQGYIIDGMTAGAVKG